MKYIVYRTTCLINNKIYVGVHHTDDPNVFDGYLGRGLWKNHTRYIKNPIAPFHCAVRKYGVENFKREVLFIYPYDKEGEEKAYNKEAEIVDEAFVARDDTYNVALGGKGRPRPARKVYQFDFNGKLIAEYINALYAAKSVEVNISNINGAIIYKRTSANSLWSDKPNININEYTITSHNKYYLYDSEGNYIRTCESNEECVKYLDTNRGNLTRAIKLQNKIRGYFISTEKYDKLQITVTKLSGKLNRYTLQGDYIDSFKTVKEAREKLGLKLCSISQAIKLGRQCNGFRWTRTDNPTPTI